MTNRIANLPRRRWRDRAADAVPIMTQALRAPHGQQTLHPIQAVSLLELWEVGGLACFADVGAGKTNVAGLTPTLLAPRGFTRPLIITPGSLRKKTEAEFSKARAHWRIASQYWLESYTALSLESRADLFERYQPDIVICDEPDPLRRLTGNAVAKRIKRYRDKRRAQRQPCAMVFLGATPDREAITDYAHLVYWACGDAAPFPIAGDDLEWQELAQWSAWLDRRESSGIPSLEKYAGGVARDWDQANAWYRDRLIQTPGVIVSDDSFNDVDLTINVWPYDVQLEREFHQLRALWQRPDGWELLNERGADDKTDPDEVNTWSVWGVARQMACGFYYRPDPLPPKAWLTARQTWVRYVRDLIDAPGSGYDTERQVRSACERSTRRIPEWEAWRDIKDTFKPGKVPVWVSRSVLDAAREWGSRAPGIIWTDHIAFGERLSQESGWTFFGQKGLDRSGRSIEDAPGNRTIIASRLANQRGRNLQYQFHRFLTVAMPNAARDCQQWLGRAHRFGQRQDVHVDVLATCKEHIRALDKITVGAERTRRQMGLTQKWLGVDVQVHGDIPNTWAFR